MLIGFNKVNQKDEVNLFNFIKQSFDIKEEDYIIKGIKINFFNGSFDKIDSIVIYTKAKNENNKSYFYKVYFCNDPFFKFNAYVREILTYVYKSYGLEQDTVYISNRYQIKRTEKLEVETDKPFYNIYKSFQKIYLEVNERLLYNMDYKKKENFFLFRNMINNKIDYVFKDKQAYLIDDNEFCLVYLDNQKQIIKNKSLNNSKVNFFNNEFKIIDQDYYYLLQDLEYVENNKKELDLDILNKRDLFQYNINILHNKKIDLCKYGYLTSFDNMNYDLLKEYYDNKRISTME